MEEALQFAQAKDTKERMAGVERLHQHLESCTKTLSSSEVTSLVDCCLDLLKDNNFRVSQGALQALASAAVLSGEHLKLHFNALVPAIVERLGDSKQPVRDAARRLLLTLMKVSSPTIILERAGSYAWTHRSWRVREEFARTVSSAISLFASTELPLQRVLLPPVLQLLNDSNNGVREAATSCIEEMYTQVGPQFRDELQHHHLPPFMLKDINARLEKIEPKIRSLDGLTGHFTTMEVKTASLPSFNQKRNSPKAKHAALESSLSGVEFLPSKLHRNYLLMRDLDKSLQVLQRQNEERCEHEIEDIQRGVESGNITPDTSLIRFSDEALDEQKHCIRVSDEKVTLAIKTYDMVDEHIQQLDKFLKKFDEELRREREVTGAAGAAAPGLDGSVKAGRGGDSSKGGRKKSNTPVELPSMDLDLPIDPNEPTYCFCNQVSYGEMIACDNPTCNIEWFHFGCVGLKEQPKGKWYCPNCAGFQKRRKGK